MTDKFRQECKNYANANRLGKIEYGDNKVISGSDFLQSLTVEDSCIVNGNINGAISSKTNKFTTLDNFEITNNEYGVKIGVKYADNSTEYIKMGKYLLQDQTNEKTAKTGEFQGLDILTNLNEKYVCNITDFTNKTIKDMLIDVLTQSNIQLGTSSFTNDNIPIIGNPFTNNETRRDVVNAILKVTLNFATVDCDDNKLYLKWLDTEVSETITKDDYSSLEKNNVYGPINCLVLRMSGVEGENVTRQDNASISSNGENQFIIEDDYFLITEELRTTYIDNLWNKIKGFTYVDCKITSSTGKPYLRAGNKISVQDDDESYFDTYVLKHTFTYDGTFQSVIESPALTKEEEKTKNIQTLKDFKKLTQIKVDKANQRIDVVVQTQEDLSDTLIPLATSNGVELKLEKSAGQPLVEFELEGNCYQESEPTPDNPQEITVIEGDLSLVDEGEQSIETTIDLQGNFIAKLPNGIEDKLYLNQGHLYLEKNIRNLNFKIADMDNSESYPGWKNLSELVKYFPGQNVALSDITKYICNISNLNGGLGMNTMTNGGVIWLSSNKFGLTQTQWKEQYPDLTFNLYYKIPTPETIDLGEYSIETLKGNSTIRAMSNLQPSNMYCKYIRDIEGLDVFQTKNDMADYYNMEQTESRISAAKDVIELSVESNKKLIDEQGKTITSLDKKVTQKIDDDGVEFKTIKDTLRDGVETLKNTLVTININGIQVSTNTSKISTIMTNDKFAIQDNTGTYLAYFGYDEEEGRSKAEMDNLTVRQYFTAGYHRTEGFTDEETNEPRTGWFYVGGSI